MSLRLFGVLSVLAFVGCTRLKYTPEADFNRDGKVSKAEYRQYKLQKSLSTGGLAGGQAWWSVKSQILQDGSSGKRTHIEPTQPVPDPTAGGNVPDPKEIGSSPSPQTGAHR